MKEQAANLTQIIGQFKLAARAHRGQSVRVRGAGAAGPVIMK